MHPIPKAAILLVDDRPDNLLSLEAILTDLGQELVQAQSGAEALRLLLKRDFALILLDIEMPDMNGFELAALIREREKHWRTPIIFLTAANKDDWQIFTGYSLGAVDYLLKPIVPEVLRSKVMVFVDLFQKTREIERQLEETRRLNSELAAANRAVVQARDEAERANAAKSEFLSRMSHELRTPLNAILGFAQLLEMDELSVEQRESLAFIQRGGEHLLSLINEVLDIARIEAGHVSISLEPIALHEVVNESLNLVEPMADLRNITLIGAGSVDPDLCVLADRQRLTQVVLNLLSNAIKYNCEYGRVTLCCERSGPGRLQLSICDTGPGIAPGDMERLFAPFERLGAERTSVEGTGLGLALSRHLIEAMGGAIEVESVVGQGTTFRIELALAEQPAASLDGPLAAVPSQHEASDHCYKVLYIEDNPSNFRLMERLLIQRPQIQLLAAMRGELGLELARAHIPNLILLDLDLPDIGGEEVLRLLREDARTCAVPVVMITADAMEHQRERLLAGGANDYMTKPLNMRLFLEMLDQTLTGTRPGGLF